MSAMEILVLLGAAAALVFWWRRSWQKFLDTVPADQRRVFEAIQEAEKLRKRSPDAADRMIAKAVAEEHDKAEAQRVSLLDRMSTDSAAADELYDLLTDDLARNAQARESVLSDANDPNAARDLEDVTKARRQILDRLGVVEAARRRHAQ